MSDTTSSNSWPYKVFYYTVMSFVIIAVSMNLFKLSQTIVFEMAKYNLDGSPVEALFSGPSYGGEYSSDQNSEEMKKAADKKREEDYKRSYIESLLSITVAVLVYVFLYYYVNTNKFSKA